MAFSAVETLRRFYSRFTGNDQVLVLINADPDAIACAMAVKRLLWRKVLNVTISNINTIVRPDNVIMVRLLGVELKPIENIKEGTFTRVVMVDSQPDHHEKFKTFIPDVIIDHHPLTATKAPFMDIRPKYGATASIMTEYLRAARIKPSAKLATGLFHAIKTDTRNFERPTVIEDVNAFQFLFKHANIALARRIEQAELRLDFLKYFKYAIQQMRVRKEKVFVNLGPVINPDICVLIADFFMRLNTINWSIVSGIYQKKLIIVFRNDGIRKNAGTVAKESFGQIGSAGGHKSMARAEIPLENIEGLADINSQTKLLRWLIRQIEKKPVKK